MPLGSGRRHAADAFELFDQLLGLYPRPQRCRHGAARGLRLSGTSPGSAQIGKDFAEALFVSVDGDKVAFAAGGVGTSQFQLDFVSEGYLPQTHQSEQPIPGQKIEDVLHARRVIVAQALDAVGKDLVDGAWVLYPFVVRTKKTRRARERLSLQRA